MAPENNDFTVPELPQIPQPAPEAGPVPAAPEPQAATEPPFEPATAGFWVRGGALFADGVLVGLPMVLLTYGLDLSNMVSTGAGVIYHTLMVGTFGQSLGKMIAGVTVVSDEGERVTYPRALARALLSLLSGALLSLGYLVAVFNPKRRTLHDYLAGTRVVYLRPVGGLRKAAAVLLPGIVLTLCLLAGVLLAMSPSIGMPMMVKLCERNSPHACYLAGSYYARPGYEGRNDFLALSYYQKACDASYSPGCKRAAKLRAAGVSEPSMPVAPQSRKDVLSEEGGE